MMILLSLSKPHAREIQEGGGGGVKRSSDVVINFVGLLLCPSLYDITYGINK